MTDTTTLHEQLADVTGVAQIYSLQTVGARQVAAASGSVAPDPTSVGDRDDIAVSELVIGLDGTAPAPEVGITVGRIVAHGILGATPGAVVVRIVSVT